MQGCKPQATPTDTRAFAFSGTLLFTTQEPQSESLRLALFCSLKSKEPNGEETTNPALHVSHPWVRNINNHMKPSAHAHI
eukprot:6492758-Amphidinium_carterae.1